MADRSCKDCAAEGITTQRPAPHPGPRCTTHHRAVTKARRQKAHGQHVERTYGITAEQYEAILAVQGGVCAICQRATGASKRLAVDHDHVTGEVRGCLCSTCNWVVIGRYTPAALARAITYLVNPPARQVLNNQEDQ